MQNPTRREDAHFHPRDLMSIPIRTNDSEFLVPTLISNSSQLIVFDSAAEGTTSSKRELGRRLLSWKRATFRQLLASARHPWTRTERSFIMSNVESTAPADFDFWEFVSCARCRLPFSLDAKATVPFWLTECAHVICNNHLNADQSCAQCGTKEIQLVPLQQEMELPMSDWFRSIPVALDGLAFAAKFQQETMASQIRRYKARHQQTREYIERLRSESMELKKANEVLARQIAQLRQHVAYQGHSDSRNDAYSEPSEVVNHNGKREIWQAQEQYNGHVRPRTLSSPHSITAPLAPNRLTLPPGQQAPNLSSKRGERTNALSSSRSQTSDNSAGAGAAYHPGQRQNQRPGSSRFVQQYAYVPPTTPQFQSPQLTHEQTAPLRVFQRTNDSQGVSGSIQAQAHAQGQRIMVPPSLPSSSRFKPPQLRTSTNTNLNAQNTNSSRNQNQASLIRHDTRQKMMGPPPIPLPQQHAPNVAPTPLSRRPISTAQASNSNRFLPPSGTANVNQHQQSTAGTLFSRNQNQYRPPPTASTAPQRFAPASGDGGLGSRAPSRASTSNMAISGGGTGQRRPFVPGGFG